MLNLDGSKFGFGLFILQSQKSDSLKSNLGISGEKYFSGFAFGDSLDVIKPDPRMVQHATKNFISDRVIYVGDSITDAKTARNSKAIFILFTEGYRQTSTKEIDPDYYFSDFSKLPAIIRDIKIN